MTARAPSVCNVPGCPTLIPAGTSRCPEHGGNQRTGSPRGSTRAWRRLRRQVLTRDGYRCTRCGTRDGLEVHHRVPVTNGGEDTIANTITLCRDCHAQTHRRAAGVTSHRQRPPMPARAPARPSHAILDVGGYLQAHWTGQRPGAASRCARIQESGA